MLHHYLITDTVPEFTELEKELPVIRDDSQVSGYIRMEQKSGLIGIYEKANATSVWDDGTPWESENELFEPDYDRIMPWLENALERMPILADKGIKSVVHGAITHPPDGNMLLGPSGVKNFWLCCGSQVGIAWGPGAGRYLAQWMVDGAADVSMRSFDPRRFGARMDDEYRIEKAKEDYLLRHEIPYPHHDRPGLRPSHSKLSPLYEILKKKGAVFEDIYGWERPFWYAIDGVARKHIESFRRSALFDTIYGRYLAQWMLDGAADVSMRSFDPRRFGARMDDEYRIEKAKEDYLLRHEIPYPHHDRPGLRPSHSKLSPLYEILKKKGAVFEDIYGWERPFWYAIDGVARKHIESFRRSALFDIIGNEVRGMRAHAGIADLSAFSKIEISGSDAESYLGRVQSNKVPQMPGSITLTYLMMDNGRIEGEATIVKLGDNHYYMVYAAIREAALLNWMQEEVSAMLPGFWGTLFD